MAKITNRKQFQIKLGGIYNYLKRHNSILLDKILPTKRPSRTLEDVIEIGLAFSSKKEWVKKDRASYEYGRRMGWLYLMTSHMINERKSWNKKKCHKSSKKYKTRTRWQNGDKQAYMAARKNGWLKECCSHMKWEGLNGTKSRMRKIIRSDGLLFNSIIEASKYMGLKSTSSISHVLSGKQKVAGGYKWSYHYENGKILK